MYGLIKATSKIQRTDTVADLARVNNWRAMKGLPTITPRGPSVRKLEDAVALGIKDVDHSDCPDLVRGKTFYLSI